MRQVERNGTMKGINEKWFVEKIEAEESGERTEYNRTEITFLRAYVTSRRNGYGVLAIEERAYDCTSEDLRKLIAEAKIESFVVADNSTGLMESLHRFMECGFEVTQTISLYQDGKPYFNPKYDHPRQGLLLERI